MSEYQNYKARFDGARASLQAPADCTVKPPQFRATDPIDPRSWDISWTLTFADGHYTCCREVWSYRPNRPPRRHYFSFHYGPIVGTDSGGNIIRKSGNPVVMRVDQMGGKPPHLHYRNPHPAPHYEQSQVDGLVLADVDMFEFVKSVFRCRSEQKEMHEIMGFKDPAA